MTDSEVSQLGWMGESRRRAFIAGLDVDPDIMDRLSALRYLRAGMLPDALRVAELVGAGDVVAVIAALMADDARAVEALEQDGSLWPVVEVMDEVPTVLSDSRLAGLRHWLALRHARTLVYDIRLREARPVLHDLLHDKPTGRFLLEAANLCAYVEAMLGSSTEARRVARRMSAVKRAPLLVERNQELLSALSRGDLEEFESPYALLGLDDGSAGWPKAWRQRTKELNRGGRQEAWADLNRGKQRLASATTSRHYVLPLEPSTFQAPAGHLLSPRAVPLARRTSVDYPSLLAEAQPLAQREALRLMTPRLTLGFDFGRSDSGSSDVENRYEDHTEDQNGRDSRR